MPRETWRLLPCLLVLGACSGAHDKPKPAPSPVPSSGSVELGTPGGDDGITFVPFDPGQVLRLQTFGQGGTHVLLAARTRGFGIRAFAAFTLTDLNTGNQLTAPEPARPQLFFCHDDVCDLAPVTIMASGLTTPDEEREGLPIEVTVNVRDDTSDLTASASENAVLSTVDLGLADAGP